MINNKIEFNKNNNIECEKKIIIILNINNK